DVVTLMRRDPSSAGTLAGVSARNREVLGEVDHACLSCGGGCPVAIRTQPVLRFRDRFRPGVDRRVRRYETCLDCGTTVRIGPGSRRTTDV
ncbi:MAG: hypothetical protein JWR28_921, partial [Modestobacter sp.]|nr:hypothetical protein [Modestobacter sp.]